MSSAEFLLPLALSCSVPLEIAALRAEGGPTEDDFAWGRAWARRLGESGDALLYRVKGKSGEMFAGLARGVAVLAFCPGGVTFAGVTYCARHGETGTPACLSRSESGQICRKCLEVEHGFAVSETAR